MTGRVSLLPSFLALITLSFPPGSCDCTHYESIRIRLASGLLSGKLGLQHREYMKLVILSGLWLVGWLAGVCVCDTFGGTREGIILFSEIAYDISSPQSVGVQSGSRNKGNNLDMKHLV